MPGFDWNGNGSHDAFDSFMDMKVMGDVNSDNGSEIDSSEDYADDFDDASDYEPARTSSYSRVRHSSFSTERKASNGMSFQDELLQSMRTPETVKKENADRLNNAMRYDAERTLREIKNALLYKAKNAEYTTENGVTSLTCFCQMPHRFMRTRREDNGDQLRQNQKNFFLFRDPKLIYMTWNNYEIEPKYSTEYRQYISALKELAAKENIDVESVVYSSKENKYVTFPSRVRNDYSFGWSLCVKATTIISGNTEKTNRQRENPTTYTPVQEITQSKNQSDTQQKEPESNGTTIIKSILCVGVCVLGFIIMANVGGLFGALALIGAAFLGYKIMNL